MLACLHSLYTSTHYVSYQSDDNILVAEAWKDIQQRNKIKEMSKHQWSQKNADAGLPIVFAQICSKHNYEDWLYCCLLTCPVALGTAKKAQASA